MFFASIFASLDIRLDLCWFLVVYSVVYIVRNTHGDLSYGIQCTVLCSHHRCADPDS